MPILPKVRDPRLITIRRGGSLTDDHHRLIAEWAARCAEHILPLFEHERPDDPRPRQAIVTARAWIRGEVNMKRALRAAHDSNTAARGMVDPAKFAAHSTAQAVAVAHVAAHNLGAAAYAIRAATAAAPTDRAEVERLRERDWQREQLPAGVRHLVLDDQACRNDICWNAFGD